MTADAVIGQLFADLDQRAMGSARGGDAVRDEDERAALRGAIDRLEDAAFRAGVHDELPKRALEGLIRCTVNSAKIEAYRKYLDGMRMKNSEFYANRAKKHLASKGIDVSSLEKEINTMHLGFIFHRMDIT